jgi:hypothetical protein
MVAIGEIGLVERPLRNFAEFWADDRPIDLVSAARYA